MPTGGCQQGLLPAVPFRAGIGQRPDAGLARMRCQVLHSSRPCRARHARARLISATTLHARAAGSRTPASGKHSAKARAPQARLPARSGRSGKWRRRESNPRPQPHRLSVYKHRRHLDLARRLECHRPTGEPAILECRASDDWLFFGAEPVSWRPTGSRALPASRRHLSCLRQRVRDRCDSHLCFAGGFTRPTGDLGLQLIRMDRPRRNQVAPVCSCLQCSRAGAAPRAAAPAAGQMPGECRWNPKCPPFSRCRRCGSTTPATAPEASVAIAMPRVG